MNDASVHLLLERRAAEAPDRTAMFLPTEGGGDAPITYRALLAATEALARAIHPRIQPGDRVLLCEPLGVSAVAAFFAIVRSGGVVVSIAPPRSAAMAAQYRRILEVARPAVAVGAKSARRTLEAAVGSHLPAWVSTEGEVLSGAPLPPARPHPTALLQFTSGSTGEPKGVVVGHRHLRHNIEQHRAAFAFDATTISVVWLPLQHSLGLVGGVLVPIADAIPVTLMAPEAVVARPYRWLKTISDRRATISGGPDFLYALCAATVTDDELATLDLSSWTTAYSGAEPVRPATLERFAARFEKTGFRMEAFHPTYGLSEATLLVTAPALHRPPRCVGFDAEHLAEGRLVESDAPNATRLAGLGHAWLDQRLAIVDAERRQSLPDGRVGEVWIHGPSVCDGYFERPDATAATFEAERADEPGVRWLRTGDLGAVWDGDLFITGRAKDLIIIGGKNLYPFDVEQTIERAHPSVGPSTTTVFGVEVEGSEHVVALVEVAPEILDETLADAEREVRAAVSAAHGVRLAALLFVPPGSTPRTASGKPRRTICRVSYREGKLRGRGGAA